MVELISKASIAKTMPAVIIIPSLSNKPTDKNSKATAAGKLLNGSGSMTANDKKATKIPMKECIALLLMGIQRGLTYCSTHSMAFAVFSPSDFS